MRNCRKDVEVKLPYLGDRGGILDRWLLGELVSRGLVVADRDEERGRGLKAKHGRKIGKLAN